MSLRLGRAGAAHTGPNATRWTAVVSSSSADRGTRFGWCLVVEELRWRQSGENPAWMTQDWPRWTSTSDICRQTASPSSASSKSSRADAWIKSRKDGARRLPRLPAGHWSFITLTQPRRAARPPDRRTGAQGRSRRRVFLSNGTPPAWVLSALCRVPSAAVSTLDWARPPRVGLGRVLEQFE